jgi:uncharacterized protein (TIGR00725 family)
MRAEPVVAVVGPGSRVQRRVERWAGEVGRHLAEHGAVVVTGGLGGVMAAASKGAADAGGQVLALLPGTDPAAANPWATQVLATGLGDARNVLVVRAADAVIALGGSWGTWSEVALACASGKPVITLGGWTVTTASGRPVTGGPRVAATPTQAVRLALRLIRHY